MVSTIWGWALKATRLSRSKKKKPVTQASQPSHISPIQPIPTSILLDPTSTTQRRESIPLSVSLVQNIASANDRSIPTTKSARPCVEFVLAEELTAQCVASSTDTLVASALSTSIISDDSVSPSRRDSTLVASSTSSIDILRDVSRRVSAARRVSFAPNPVQLSVSFDSKDAPIRCIEKRLSANGNESADSLDGSSNMVPAGSGADNSTCSDQRLSEPVVEVHPAVLAAEEEIQARVIARIRAKQILQLQRFRELQIQRERQLAAAKQEENRQPCRSRRRSWANAFVVGMGMGGSGLGVL
ncbi:hypothetical protein BC832DRAFT_591055 [Gaertneriomyces semiglobifer]|nr:hypothetical protein BC832DRAFT_591055 [Gaertneriomyces semiglobifer]